MEAIEFSKYYKDKSNPQSGFAAILVCNEADAECPVVPGASTRIFNDILDPKSYDDSVFESGSTQKDATILVAPSSRHGECTPKDSGGTRRNEFDQLVTKSRRMVYATAARIAPHGTVVIHAKSISITFLHFACFVLAPIPSSDPHSHALC